MILSDSCILPLAGLLYEGRDERGSYPHLEGAAHARPVSTLEHHCRSHPLESSRLRGEPGTRGSSSERPEETVNWYRSVYLEDDGFPKDGIKPTELFLQ